MSIGSLLKNLLRTCIECLFVKNSPCTKMRDYIIKVGKKQLNVGEDLSKSITNKCFGIVPLSYDPNCK